MATPGKDPKTGRFLPGNRLAAKENGGRGGRPKRSVEESYLTSLRDEVDDEKFRDSVRWVLEHPSVTGIKLLWSYLMGAPPDSIEIQGSITTFVEYVNDWRNWESHSPDAPPGTEDSSS